MERGDCEDDAGYPRAPVPAHERTWRHPSEFGAERWVRTEPPLVVGRGLSVATGTVGAVLALGLLWVMVPHGSRAREVATQASTSAIRATASINTTMTTASTAQPTPAVAPDSSVDEPTIEPPSRNLDSLPTTAETQSIPTMVLDDGARGPIELAPVAVALMPGHYVVTTAAAARGREGFVVQLPSGETVVGAVVSVDVENGTAVLSITADVDMALIEASETQPGDGGFMVMTPEATSASLWVNDRGTQVGYAGESSTTGEGSVVLDGFGRLVGLCTKSFDGVQLVTVEALINALERATSASSPPWMGITADVDQDGRVVVTDVGTGGPAAAAGVQIGDIIAGIDGHALADLEALRAVIGNHLAGDTIDVTIDRRAGDSASTATTSNATTTTANASATSTQIGTPQTEAHGGSGAVAFTTTTSSTAATTSVTTPLTTPITLRVTLGHHPSSIESRSDN